MDCLNYAIPSCVPTVQKSFKIFALAHKREEEDYDVIVL